MYYVTWHENNRSYVHTKFIHNFVLQTDIKKALRKEITKISVSNYQVYHGHGFLIII